ncbi:MAG: NFACT RNA binding domain-containing protein [Pyrinomonadaceae bacterium]
MGQSLRRHAEEMAECASADYFAEGAPEIEIEVDDNLSLQDEAARRYQMYGKSKRAAQEIDRRLAELEKEISHLSEAQLRVETAIAERDYAAFPQSVEGGKQPFVNKSIRKKLAAAHTGLKRYRSSDGYEVLVGRGAQDNDRLTFRVARSHDLWLHAADYPGAHVVIVNHDRNHDVPQRTIIEAAQAAAYHSQAKGDAKVNIHYAQRKHISKPRGATPAWCAFPIFAPCWWSPAKRSRASKIWKAHPSLSLARALIIISIACQKKTNPKLHNPPSVFS